MTRPIILADIDNDGAVGGPYNEATEMYCTWKADSPTSTLYGKRLLTTIYERAISFPFWNRQGGGQAISVLEFNNVDGALDYWLGLVWKDVRVVLKGVQQRAAYSTAEQLGVVVVARIEAPAANRIQLVCRSVYERLEKVITGKYANTITNESLRESPKPITLGHVRWMDPANSRLNSGSTRAIYDIADGPFDRIVELRQRGAPCTEVQAPLPISGSQYLPIQQASTGYGFLFNAATNRLAAEVHGQLRVDTQLATNSTFPTATSGEPTGWSGGSTWNSAGSVTIVTDGTTQNSVLQTITTVVGVKYRVEVDVTTQAGVCYFDIAGVLSARGFEDATGTTVVAGTYTAVGTSTVFGITVPIGASCNITISAIRVYRVYAIDSLSEICRFAGITRGDLTTADFDLSAMATLEAAFPYKLAFHNQGGEVRGIDLVQRAVAAYGAAFYQDANGYITPVQICKPEDQTADWAMNEREIPGDVTYEVDLAPGLSTRMNYGINYAPHSVDESVGAAPTPGVVAELQREYLTVTSTIDVHDLYAEARTRDPLESILSDQADAQDEIERVCDVYDTPRGFYTLRAYPTSAIVPIGIGLTAAYVVQPGDIVLLTHSRYGLQAGKKLMVVLAKSDFAGGSTDVVLWG